MNILNKLLRSITHSLPQYRNKLRTAEVHLSCVINTIPGNHWWKDLEGRYLGCNDIVAKLLGFSSAKEIIGKTDYDLPWANQAYQLEQADKEVIRTGHTTKIEEQVEAKDGKLLTFLVIKAPLRNKNEIIIGTIGTSFDITKQKEAEASLIEHAKKTVQYEALKSRMEFISVASHEIRGPVSNIISCLQMSESKLIEAKENLKNLTKKITNSEKNSIIQAEINSAYNQIERAIGNGQLASDESFRVIEALKNIGNLYQLRIEGIKEQLEEISIEDLIKRILNHFVGNKKQISFEFEIDKEIPKNTRIDYKLAEVLQIVINNAIRFSHEKNKIKILAGLMPKQASREWMELIVEDSGVGMSVMQLSNLFNTILNEDGEDQAKNMYRKPSIQLSIAKIKIAALGGQIRFESEADKGTKVFLAFPYQRVSREQHDSDAIQEIAYASN